MKYRYRFPQHRWDCFTRCCFSLVQLLGTLQNLLVHLQSYYWTESQAWVPLTRISDFTQEVNTSEEFCPNILKTWGLQDSRQDSLGVTWWTSICLRLLSKVPKAELNSSGYEMQRTRIQYKEQSCMSGTFLLETAINVQQSAIPMTQKRPCESFLNNELCGNTAQEQKL